MITYTCDRCGKTTRDAREVWLPEFKQMEGTGPFPVPKRDAIWHVCGRCVESFYQRLAQEAPRG